MKKTFKDLQEVDQLVGLLYQKTPTLRETKFGYAYKKFTDKNYSPLVKEFQEELNNIRVDSALEDPVTKEILMDQKNARGFKYSKAGLKTVIEQEKNLLDRFYAKEVEIEPYISSFVPEDLTEEETALLEGLVI